MRSSVVARSIPWRISLSLSARSQLSAISSVIKISGSGICWLLVGPALLEDLPLNLQKAKLHFKQSWILLKTTEEFGIEVISNFALDRGFFTVCTTSVIEPKAFSFWRAETKKESAENLSNEFLFLSPSPNEIFGIAWKLPSPTSILTVNPHSAVLCAMLDSIILASLRALLVSASKAIHLPIGSLFDVEFSDASPSTLSSLTSTPSFLLLPLSPTSRLNAGSNTSIGRLWYLSAALEDSISLK
nr:hypothetical protein Iba_chr10cCG7170 [Ipomoea batatas]